MITVVTLSFAQYRIEHMHENMAYTIVQNCPQTFRDWSSRASSKCNNEKYHCMEDENSRRVEVCAVPNWIKGGILYLKG